MEPFPLLIFIKDFQDSLNVSKSIQLVDGTFIYYSRTFVTNREEMLNRDLLSIPKYLKFKELIINLDNIRTKAMLFETAKRLQLILIRLSFFKVVFPRRVVNLTPPPSDTPSYFKKNLYNINITLYNC